MTDFCFTFEDFRWYFLNGTKAKIVKISICLPINQTLVTEPINAKEKSICCRWGHLYECQRIPCQGTEKRKINLSHFQQSQASFSGFKSNFALVFSEKFSLSFSFVSSWIFYVFIVFPSLRFADTHTWARRFYLIVRLYLVYIFLRRRQCRCRLTHV